MRHLEAHWWKPINEILHSNKSNALQHLENGTVYSNLSVSLLCKILKMGLCIRTCPCHWSAPRPKCQKLLPCPARQENFDLSRNNYGQRVGSFSLSSNCRSSRVKHGVHAQKKLSSQKMIRCLNSFQFSFSILSVHLGSELVLKTPTVRDSWPKRHLSISRILWNLAFYAVLERTNLRKKAFINGASQHLSKRLREIVHNCLAL